MQPPAPPLPVAPPPGTAPALPAGRLPMVAPSRKAARYALEWGVGLSLLLHALLLSVRFVMPDASHFQRTHQDLAVVLVNARHAQRPDKADLLAQTTLDAGGTNTPDARASTPLPPQTQSRAGDGIGAGRDRERAVRQPRERRRGRGRIARRQDRQRRETPRDAAGSLDRAHQTVRLRRRPRHQHAQAVQGHRHRRALRPTVARRTRA